MASHRGEPVPAVPLTVPTRKSGLIAVTIVSTSALLIAAASLAQAQTVPPRVGPSQIVPPLPERGERERPDLPGFQPAEPDLLPPPVLVPPERAPLAQGPRVFVKGYRFEGNTAIPAAALEAVAAPFVGREVSADELQELRYRLTEIYVDRGFVTSGAVLPDQDVTDGIVTFRIVEGALAGIDVTGTGGLDPRYVERRLTRGIDTPLDVNALRERVLLLLQDPLIERLNAELEPGERLGESRLGVAVTRAPPYALWLNLDNAASPTTGELRGNAYGILRNLTGWGDALELNLERTQGSHDYWAAFEAPVSAAGTTLRVRAEESRARIVEAPLSELDIQSRVRTYEAGISHPVLLTPRDRVDVGLTLSRSRTETFLLGRPFTFSEGVEDGRAILTVLRLSQNWLRRRPEEVIALRSVFSLGINALGATVHSEPGVPDGQFLAWLGQFQWARRLDERGDQIVLRADAQLANDTLLPAERIAIGGFDTVRGYRENTLIRDQGLILSLEGRVPLFQAPLPVLSRDAEDGRVSLVPFVDYGRGWNHGEPTPAPRAIASVGLGLRWDVSADISLQFTYAHPLRDVPDVNGGSLQDHGIHFRITGRVF
ncbi:ShlB/FhaC/HecB family hemolysin secretion/activation protein [Azospirillum canadense]|uniref:ShlB/FhaC/HecB family hemolysin secretion/activation protein n=1 Tax=Azospirillum canadense TaxID=403962 RepID=UPI002227D8C2|nr:ShlB/FhaC/HecB family hemolysin secretion/activation protein [Azospirillum canadense]MCW2239664.1 hemolysin activation/secretion protein [Azospirillum canadense]